MAWRSERTRTGTDMVWEGVETGIAPSPTLGTANIQNANISSQTGEVMASYDRVSQTPASLTGQTLTPDGATNFTGPASLQAGQWISVSASTVTSISTSSATQTTLSIDYLVVGGGGGGGGAKSLGDNLDASGGGGGAGEVKTGTTNVSVTTYAVVIGDGGAGGDAASGQRGSDGESTTFGSLLTAVGGGGGGGSLAAQDDGASGGSGGGGGGEASVPTSGTGGTGTAGNNGGGGTNGGSGGGGGGAGAVGSDGPDGDGGIGVSSSITGTATYYGGGGGGGDAGGVTPDPGEGGDGGGGRGGSTTGSGGATAATAGTANTGGGGGGAGTTDGLSMAGAAGGSGIVVISYTTGSAIAIGGTVTYGAGKTIHTFTTDGTFVVLAIQNSTYYYVSYKNGTTYKLSAKFDPTGANAITHGTTGSVTFSTVATPGSAIAKALEEYTTTSSVEQRYYILDSNSYLWMFDSYIYETYGTKWMLPDPNNYSTLALTGVGAINGQVLLTGRIAVYGKPTTDLGRMLKYVDSSLMNDTFSNHRKFAYVGKQGKMYWCDGNYIGEIFPTTSFVTSEANIQSICSYTASTTTGTISSIISGSLPRLTSGTRVPVVFYTDVYGTQPTNVGVSQVYFITCDPITNTFQAYSAITGGSPINLATGAAGNQYFTTFWPYDSYAGATGADPLVQVTSQRVNLPTYETAQSMVEVGNLILIGCNGSTLYPWNQIDATPSDAIELPEANVKTMINVNNMAYVFAGNKGNVYISNSSIASLALKVPDYCAGVPGTPLTYIEPYFTWGDAMYTRGRVYFSILDQTATKAGNCGGIWSFVPTQNIDPNQSVGMALRLENRNSYGDYDGYCTILIPNEEQNAVSPQYWSAWQDSYSTGTSSFGIDYTGTTPVNQYIIETDLVPTGTLLEKQTFAQLEYKLTTPLASGDSVQLYYRLNSTDAWTTCGTVREEADKIAGYFDQAFQKTQWVQFRAVITTPGTTASSFVRLKQIRLR